MILLNFARPFTEEQQEELSRLVAGLGQTLEGVRDLPSQIDTDAILHREVSRLIDQVGWSEVQWKQNRGTFLVKLPNLAEAAALMAHEICFLAGQIDIVRLKPVINGAVTQYHVAEILCMT